jgi:hypothetical protein
MFIFIKATEESSHRLPQILPHFLIHVYVLLHFILLFICVLRKEDEQQV